MKRCLAILLAFLVLTGCSAGAKGEKMSGNDTQPIQTETEELPSAENNEASVPIETVYNQDQSAQSLETDRQLVELTIPADFVGDASPYETISDEAKTEGFISANHNNDGSVTIVMTKTAHNKIIEDIRQQIDDQLSEMAADADFPSILSIDANEDYTSFTVILSTDTVELPESVLALSLYFYSGIYSIFNATQVDNVSVQFVDQSGAIIHEVNSNDMQ